MEIKTDLIKLPEGSNYIVGPDDYLITESHTHMDILRFMVQDIGIDDVQTLLDLERDSMETRQ